MSALYVVLAALATGYGLGRWQPLHRASDWANWQRYDRSIRRHSARWWAGSVVLSAENIGWLLAHPVQGWDVWKHRSNPPSPKSAPAPVYDPDWAQKRTHHTPKEPK